MVVFGLFPFLFIALSVCNIKGRVGFKRGLKINIANLSLKEYGGILFSNSRIGEKFIFKNKAKKRIPAIGILNMVGM